MPILPRYIKRTLVVVLAAALTLSAPGLGAYAAAAVVVKTVLNVPLGGVPAGLGTGGMSAGKTSFADLSGIASGNGLVFNISIPTVNLPSTEAEQLSLPEATPIESEAAVQSVTPAGEVAKPARKTSNTVSTLKSISKVVRRLDKTRASSRKRLSVLREIFDRAKRGSESSNAAPVPVVRAGLKHIRLSRRISRSRRPATRSTKIKKLKNNALLGGLTAARQPEKASQSADLFPEMKEMSAVEEYQVPGAISRLERTYLALQLAFSASSIGLLIAGIGLSPFALATGIVLSIFGKDIISYSPVKILAKRTHAGASRHTDFERRVAELTKALLGRLGLSEDKMPAVTVGGLTDFAWTTGKIIGPTGVIVLNPRMMSFPVAQIAAVLAHELGHLHFGDNHPLNHLRGSAKFGIIILAIVTALGLPLMWITGLPPVTFSSVAAPVLFSFLSAAIGFAFGKARARQMELRADHFAAWLTQPLWLEEFLRVMKWNTDSSKGFWSRLKSIVLEEHPSNVVRIRRLTGYRASLQADESARPR